jgi:hypothetical protein
MLQWNRSHASGTCVGALTMVLMVGCPFEEKLYGSGSSEVGGGGQGGGPVCRVPDPLIDEDRGEFSVNLFSDINNIAVADRCYALFVLNEEGYDWLNASVACTSLRSEGMWLHARLVAISGLDEHKAILDWLVPLRDKGTFEGPWTLGKRDESRGKLEPGAFFWDTDASEEPWNIFPCDTCDKTTRSLFWGNDGTLQPNGQSSDDSYCVRYGLSSGWKSKGLDDTSCNDDRTFVCEWPRW